MRFRLIPLDGSPPIEVSKDMMVVGRADDADIRIDHKSISKRHTILVRGDGVLVVRDLGSTNGTHVNGQRVRRSILMPDDLIAFANFRFRMMVGDTLPNAPLPADRGPSPDDAIDEPPDTPPPTYRPDQPKMRRNTLPDVYEK